MNNVFTLSIIHEKNMRILMYNIHDIKTAEPEINVKYLSYSKHNNNNTIHISRVVDCKNVPVSDFFFFVGIF